jgi:hypothetical protein
MKRRSSGSTLNSCSSTALPPDTYLARANESAHRASLTNWNAGSLKAPEAAWRAIRQEHTAAAAGQVSVRI